MAKSVYSFGEDSPLKMNVPDKTAKLYNEAVDEWYKAQQRFKQRWGHRWDPINEPLKLKWNRNHIKAWNDFADIFNKALSKQGPFHENDLMEDFLVKNVTDKQSRVTWKFNRFIAIAVAGGALYGFLNKRKPAEEA